MKASFVIALLLVASDALSAQSRHQQLAEEFDRLAIDQDAAIAEIVEITITQTPELGASKQQITEQLRAFSRRPEVIRERVQSYMRDFSESELEQAVTILKSPGYKVLQAKSFQVRNPFYASLIKFRPSVASKSGKTP